MASSDTVYTVDFSVPELIEKGRDNLLKCPVYRDAALVAPSAGTVSVLNGAAVAIVDEQAVTVTGSIAQYTVPTATLADQVLGESWRVVWTLTLAGIARQYDRDAALVRRRLFPVVTHADLYKRAPALNPSDAGVLHSRTDFQNELDAAWNFIEHRLIAIGRRPWLIVSPTALRLATFELWLAYIFEGLSHRLTEAYEAKAEMHRERFENEFARVRLLYDADDDGEADTNHRVGVTPILWTA